MHDVYENADVKTLGARYVPLDELYAAADVITLALPADAADVSSDRRGDATEDEAGRDADQHQPRRLVDTQAAIDGLKDGRIGYLGLDVYEEEEDLFFQDLSNRVIQDDVFSRLLTFPNVLVTAHQAFFTREALQSIAAQTIGNLTAFDRGQRLVNEVTVEHLRR